MTKLFQKSDETLANAELEGGSMQESAKTLLIKLIKEHFARDQEVSLRTCAKDIGISAASLSGFLNNKRSISQKMAAKIVEKIPISRSDRQYILENWSRRNRFESINDVPMVHRVIDSIYYFAVIDLFETANVEHDHLWVADRLQLTQKKTRQILETLVAFEFLIKTSQQTYRTTGKKFAMGGDLPRNDMRSVFMSTLDVTRTVMDRLDRDSRWRLSDTSTMVFPIARSKIPEAKKRLKKFRRSLADLLSAVPCDEVYMLAINLIPLTDVRQSE